MDRKSTDPGHLLDWLTHHHLPLMMYREGEEDNVDGGNWVVVDASTASVLGSGETAYQAIGAAYDKREASTNE